MPTNPFDSKARQKDLHDFIETFTANTGQNLVAIANNPIFKTIQKIFGFGWLAAIVGDVDVAMAQAEIQRLKQAYPNENPTQLTQRVIQAKSLEAAKLGFVANLLPPLALALFGWELASMTKLQAEMVYQISGLHGLNLQDPRRRAEILAIFGLSLGGNGLKTGLSFFEMIPLVGTVVGVSSNSLMMYSLGLAADQFYRFKQNAQKYE
ncbi:MULTISPECIES: hypothetical protein [Cyanophyceae]|uniref:hypothetical protein n=1 Tax=Cyanophyceae TaxID=3028117 RepID=UPI00016DC389|nr:MULTISPECIES: hypothetical protein [Cyanophyceae]ACB01161.1 conserved hypothetical protein [Picosynechococcus sp. PCC 7002]SMH48186.1 hypothetical protein SAMN06272755_1891 [Picosynechococcus sp. OG1]SMQ81213.1 hypothetical protein SAMN06272774_1170 [Synechococcus sp. 7002]